MGRGAVSTAPDEIILDCDDSYQGLPEKVRAICKWSSLHEYDYTVKIDDDVLILPTWACPQAPYTGRHNSFVLTLKDRIKQPWGFLYCLNRECTSILANAELPADNCDERWCTKELYRHGITLQDEPRYCLHGGVAEEFVGNRRCIYDKITKTFSPFGECPHTATAISTYIEWMGVHRCPTERVIQELHKIWKERKGNMSVKDLGKEELKNHNNMRDGRLPEGVVPTDNQRFGPVVGELGTANEKLAKNPKLDLDIDCR